MKYYFVAICLIFLATPVVSQQVNFSNVGIGSGNDFEIRFGDSESYTSENISTSGNSIYLGRDYIGSDNGNQRLNIEELDTESDRIMDFGFTYSQSTDLVIGRLNDNYELVRDFSGVTTSLQTSSPSSESVRFEITNDEIVTAASYFIQRTTGSSFEIDNIAPVANINSSDARLSFNVESEDDLSNLDYELSVDKINVDDSVGISENILGNTQNYNILETDIVNTQGLISAGDQVSVNRDLESDSVYRGSIELSSANEQISESFIFTTFDLEASWEYSGESVEGFRVYSNATGTSEVIKEIDYVEGQSTYSTEIIQPEFGVNDVIELSVTSYNEAGESSELSENIVLSEN